NTGTLIGAASGTTLFVTGTVSGSDLAKVGAGSVTLLAPNTYTGATVVIGGTLTLSNTNNSATGPTTVSGIAQNGTFTTGTLVVNLLGTLPTSLVTIDQGGILTLDDTGLNGSTIPITAASESGTTVTITTSVPHNLAVGQPITLGG